MGIKENEDVCFDWLGSKLKALNEAGEKHQCTGGGN
jgi:hypothetical protein